MRRSATSALLLLGIAALLCGCGSGPGQPAMPEGMPKAHVVLVVLDSLPPGRMLPETLSAVTPLPIAWARLSDHPGEIPDVAGLFLESAVREGMLVAAVDEPLPMSGRERDDIAVMTVEGSGSLLVPVSIPPEVGADMAWADWADLGERSIAVARMLEKYKPDILVFRCAPGLQDAALEVSSHWLEAADSLAITLVIYAPPLPGRSRGWAAVAGMRAGRGLVEGLAPDGLLGTLQILAGIPWELSVAGGVPAAGALDLNPFRDLQERR